MMSNSWGKASTLLALVEAKQEGSEGRVPKEAKQSKQSKHFFSEAVVRGEPDEALGKDLPSLQVVGTLSGSWHIPFEGSPEAAQDGSEGFEGPSDTSRW